MKREDQSSLLFDRPAPHIAVVTINRPEARNAINADITVKLGRLVKTIEEDPEIWVAILTGAGDRAFCAGADLKEVSAGHIDRLETSDGGFAGFAHASRLKPWIAAVNGPALAGGTELALACDMIVASKDATFGLPEVKRGLMALAGGLYRLPRSMGRALALELIATGEPISADRALSMNLINRVAPTGSAREEAIRLAQAIASNAPLAVRHSLEIARQAFDLTETELASRCKMAGNRLARTSDYKEGPLAFIEKRSPKWVGS